MRPVSTMRSLDRCVKMSRSGRWIVTGTTASSGDHSIITGRNDFAGRFLHQRRQKFGVPGLGKAPIVEHILGDRIGDDGGRRAGHDVGDRAADRSDGGRRARAIGLARLCGDGDIERARPAAPCEKPPRPTSRRHDGDRHVKAKPGGAAAREIGIGDDIEWRQLEFGAPPPDRQREIRADPGRLAERQCQRLHDRSSIA